MKKIALGMMLAAIITGCSSLPTKKYKELETEYEKLLSSNITDQRVSLLEEKYLELKNDPEFHLSDEDMRKINIRLQILEDLKN